MYQNCDFPIYFSYEATLRNILTPQQHLNYVILTFHSKCEENVFLLLCFFDFH